MEASGTWVALKLPFPWLAKRMRSQVEPTADNLSARQPIRTLATSMLLPCALQDGHPQTRLPPFFLLYDDLHAPPPTPPHL